MLATREDDDADEEIKRAAEMGNLMTMKSDEDKSKEVKNIELIRTKHLA